MVLWCAVEQSNFRFCCTELGAKDACADVWLAVPSRLKCAVLGE